MGSLSPRLIALSATSSAAWAGPSSTRASSSAGSSTPSRRWAGAWTNTLGDTVSMVIRRTRIVCTLGPSSASPPVLRKMLKAGMDVARLNFSHGDHDTHRQAAIDARAAAEADDRPVAFLCDLQGPK